MRRYIIRIDDDIAEAFEQWVDAAGVSVTAVIQAGIAKRVSDWEAHQREDPNTWPKSPERDRELAIIEGARTVDARRRRRAGPTTTSMATMFLVFAMASMGTHSVAEIEATARLAFQQQHAQAKQVQSREVSNEEPRASEQG